MFEKKKQITLFVEGMKCSGCVHRIENILAIISEISSYNVDLTNKKVEITYKGELNTQQLSEKINNLGFQVMKIV